MERFRNNFKKPAANPASNRQARVDMMTKNRKEKRGINFAAQRNIEIEQQVEDPVDQNLEPQIEVQTRVKDNQRIRLQKWKAEKEKQKLEQKKRSKNQQPFKVGVVHQSLANPFQFVSLHPVQNEMYKNTRSVLGITINNFNFHLPKPAMQAPTPTSCIRPDSVARASTMQRELRSRTKEQTRPTKIKGPGKAQVMTPKVVSASRIAAVQPQGRITRRKVTTPHTATSASDVQVKEKVAAGVPMDDAAVQPQSFRQGRSTRSKNTTPHTALSGSDVQVKEEVAADVPMDDAAVQPQSFRQGRSTRSKNTTPHTALSGSDVQVKEEVAADVPMDDAAVQPQGRSTRSKNTTPHTAPSASDVQVEEVIADEPMDNAVVQSQSFRQGRSTRSKNTTPHTSFSGSDVQVKEKVAADVPMDDAAVQPQGRSTRSKNTTPHTAPSASDVQVEEVIADEPMDNAVVQSQSFRQGRSTRSKNTTPHTSLSGSDVQVKEKVAADVPMDDAAVQPQDRRVSARTIPHSADVQENLELTRKFDITMEVVEDHLQGGHRTSVKSKAKAPHTAPSSSDLQAKQGMVLLCAKSDEVSDAEEPLRDCAYFRDILATTISSLEKMCEHWEQVREESGGCMTEEALEQVLLATGMARLLIREKFAQFSGLIDSCQDPTAETKTLCSDLQGFWDMIYMQAEDIERKFKELEVMKNNNWKRVELTVRVKPQKKKPAAVKLKVGAPKGPSKFRAFLSATRKNQAVGDALPASAVCAAASDVVHSPVVQRRSLARTSISTPKKVDSPNVFAILSVSRIAKSAGKKSLTLNESAHDSPALKQASTTKLKSKTPTPSMIPKMTTTPMPVTFAGKSMNSSGIPTPRTHPKKDFPSSVFASPKPMSSSGIPTSLTILGKKNAPTHMSPAAKPINTLGTTTPKLTISPKKNLSTPTSAAAKSNTSSGSTTPIASILRRNAAPTPESAAAKKSVVFKSPIAEENEEEKEELFSLQSVVRTYAHQHYAVSPVKDKFDELLLSPPPARKLSLLYTPPKVSTSSDYHSTSQSNTPKDSDDPPNRVKKQPTPYRRSRRSQDHMTVAAASDLMDLNSPVTPVRAAAHAEQSTSADLISWDSPAPSGTPKLRRSSRFKRLD